MADLFTKHLCTLIAIGYKDCGGEGIEPWLVG